MSDPARVLTTGRLDGLMITPVAADGELRSLDLTVNTLPGMRLVVEVEAARELHKALGIILGMFGPP